MGTFAFNSVDQPARGLVANQLPASARVGRVRLAVSDLEQSVGFYARVIGLAVLERTATAEGNPLARLGVTPGAERVLLELEEQAAVHPIRERSRLGLYHTAFLLPRRLDLALFVAHLRSLGVAFGAGDHGVSEAIYLVDPDGLEVEVYADRPRAVWPYGRERLRMGTEAVRFDELAGIAAVSGNRWRGAPAETRVGHVHFYVGDLDQAAAFYCAGLGMDGMVQMPSALFVSAGGYHHHVGLNVWATGAPAASAEDARLLYWELSLPDLAEVHRVADRMVASGAQESACVDGTPAFVDSSGIVVRLVNTAEASLD